MCEDDLLGSSDLEEEERGMAGGGGASGRAFDLVGSGMALDLVGSSKSAADLVVLPRVIGGCFSATGSPDSTGSGEVEVVEVSPTATGPSFKACVLGIGEEPSFTSLGSFHSVGYCSCGNGVFLSSKWPSISPLWEGNLGV